MANVLGLICFIVPLYNFVLICFVTCIIPPRPIKPGIFIFIAIFTEIAETNPDIIDEINISAMVYSVPSQAFCNPIPILVDKAPVMKLALVILNHGRAKDKAPPIAPPITAPVNIPKTSSTHQLQPKKLPYLPYTIKLLHLYQSTQQSLNQVENQLEQTFRSDRHLLRDYSDNTHIYLIRQCFRGRDNLRCPG